MAFFDKLGETISSKSKDVAQKAKDLAEIASLNGKISTQEEIIRKAYLEIGQKYYEKYKLDTSNEFDLECEAITDAFDEISKIKSEIQVIKNTKICPNCGEEVPSDAVFCSKCGTHLEVESVAPETDNTESDTSNEESEVLVCPGCNEVIEDDVKFCTKCGYQLKE